ncbi:hypothetical protein J2X04_003205 [Lysobacter niabensis]|uniref:Lipoprotein n=1 Tax=Agrilutibacter niabensis TaxID=380628 RepID=A0ABU1VTM9_9GAMM|nr:hypothetical protein [Lysobacter niabensis]MDR7100824.1 hypothetical protein [Lysobacter niabensis]
MRPVVLALICVSAVACNRVDPAQTAAATATASAAATAPVVVEKPIALAELKAEQVAASPALSDACNLESIAGTVVPDGRPIESDKRVFAVSGWAIDDKAKAAPAELDLRAYSTSGDGRVWQIALPRTVARPDVQAARGGSEKLLNSGFSAQVDAAGLPPGQYSLRLTFQDGGTETICDNGRAVVLK